MKILKTILDKNKLRYKQEAGRMISYVSFSAAPNVKDSILAKASVLALKNNFVSDTNPKAFVSRNISAINYSDAYTLKIKNAGLLKDSIISLPDGGVYGPYLEGDNYVLAKKVSTKILPDSIKCRHILIGTTDRKQGSQLWQILLPNKKLIVLKRQLKAGQI